MINAKFPNTVIRVVSSYLVDIAAKKDKPGPIARQFQEKLIK